MQISVRHSTVFAYDQAVSEAYTEVRLRPLDRAGQRCLAFVLRTDPREAAREYADSFGNAVHHFDHLAPHERLAVVAESEVTTSAAALDPTPSLAPLDRWALTQPTAFAPFSRELVAFGRMHAVPGNEAATADALLHAVFNALTYEKGSTTVTTTASEALDLGVGVCQDFAHVYLAAARSQGLVARYVSGYLFSPGDPWGGGGDGDATASHAWVDVFIPGRGWLALDPTHDAVQDGHYVRVAVGRDYADVPPTRGVYKGAAHETLTVDVRLSEPGGMQPPDGQPGPPGDRG